MKKIALVGFSLTSLLLATPQPYEVSITAGGTKAEGDMKLDDHANYGIRFGIENNLLLEKTFDTIEFVYERSENVDYENTVLETDINRYSVNFIHSYKNFESFVPYGLVGIGYEDFTKEYLKANDSIVANIGIGVKYFLNDVVSLRAEVRDQINLEHSVQHEMIYTVGVGYSFGEGAKKEVIKQEKIVETPVKMKEETKEEQSVVALDRDNDGVLDTNDKCPNTLEGCSVDVNGCAIDYTFDVNFDVDKYDIKKEDIAKLTKFVDFMNMMTKYKAVINGHTDATASELYNMNLSIKRAKAVMDKLIELGLNKEKVSFKGYGESKPIATNETVSGKAKNRRVEAQIIK